MANSWRAFRFLSDASRFFSNIRRDILGNLNDYEARFTRGDSAADILAVSAANAGHYQRLLDEVKNRWDDLGQQQAIKDSLTALGFGLTDIVDEYQDLRSAADIEAAATTLQELNAAAVTIRGALSDYSPLI